MDKVIKENNEKKALKLAYKKLLKEINVEFTKGKRLFGRNTKRILVLGKNHAHLLFAILEKSLDEENTLELDNLNLFGFESSLELWGCPIYVSDKEDVVMLIASLGNLVDSSFMKPFIERKDGSYVDALDMQVLIDELPEEAKLKKV